MKDLTPYLPSLLQLESGLSSSGLLTSIKQRPDVWESIFKCSNSFQMTTDEFLDELEVNYSSLQLEKDLEITTFKFFSDVVENLESSK